MARFAILLPLVGVAFLAIQMNKMAMGELTCSSQRTCTDDAASDNPDPSLASCPSQNNRICCDGLKIGRADDNSTYVINTGTCTCCSGNEECRLAEADSDGDDTDAHATVYSCRNKND